MWSTNWRDETWAQLESDGPTWDLIVIGGGITGAGIFREGTRLRLRTLLVEKRDFCWGTSSRSSKLVHGGLRYLKERRLRLTRASVHERERLLHEGPGLIDPLGFLLATYEGDRPGRWIYGAGLSVYDLLALQWTHERYSADDFRMLAPHISQEGLKGGFRYGDAQTDDARLVLRVIREAVADGGLALNYASVEEVLHEKAERASLVRGVRLRDEVTGRTLEVFGRVVINATGVWADRLREQVGARPRMRPLRGSHLIFPAWRLPVAQAISFLHPVDQRPVFIFPWEGITLVGTTDVEHDHPLAEEPTISGDEVTYLMAAVEAQFPSLQLGLDDVVSTFAGLRPVIGTGQADPCKESRDHVVWEENGLLTVTGGKLTTFRLIALDALRAVRRRLPNLPSLDDKVPVLDAVDLRLPGAEHLDEMTRRRLVGRYGADAPDLVQAAEAGELEPIPRTEFLWAELRWAARAEGVVHLDDLLMRRVRLGHVLARGGESMLPQVRAICQAELGWDDVRWQAEAAEYLRLWQSSYGLPARETVRDWKSMLVEAREARAATRPSRRRKIFRRTALLGSLVALVVVVAFMYRRYSRG